MKTKTINLYEFKELSEDAKEKARNWYRSLVFSDSCDWESVYEMAQTAGEILGITFDTRKGSSQPCIWFSGFSSQGDGACFDGSYRYAKEALKKIKKEFPEDKELQRIAKELQEVQSRQFYKLYATCRQSGHYNHSGCMRVNVEHTEDRYKDLGSAEDDITQLMRDFADWIYNALEKEYEYQCSDEAVEEAITSNEYTFTEDGERED